jgi:hypothetical protein
MAVLEETVRELKEALKAFKPAPDWLDRVIGSMKGTVTIHGTSPWHSWRRKGLACLLETSVTIHGTVAFPPKRAI